MCAGEGGDCGELLLPRSFEFLLQFVLLCSRTSLTQEETLTPEGSCKGMTLLSVSYSPGDVSANDKDGKVAGSERWSGAGRVHPYEPLFRHWNPKSGLTFKKALHVDYIKKKRKCSFGYT